MPIKTMFHGFTQSKLGLIFSYGAERKTLIFKDRVPFRSVCLLYRC